MKAPRGQNFLYQPAWLDRVAAAIGPADTLIEIGGGPGNLTSRLARQTRQLLVIESDRALAAGLAAAGYDVRAGDVLTMDLTALANGARVRVAGNLPYYITSPILLHLFHHAAAITDATVMVQREVADRLAAVPATRAFGLLTATAQFYAPRISRLLEVPPGAFRPRPKVSSTLVRLEFAPQAAALGVDEAGFMQFLRRAFAQKRKQLGPRLGLAGLQARAESLSLAELAALYHRLRG
ncbi:MAG: 16S rRNA (adenine(1518)-N(6)/adenine(1519)-N(6))-dimethyltransferase RsmA [Terriglobales bacterium]